MTADERTRLNELMHRLATGDDDAVFVLHDEYGPWLAAKMRQHVAALHAQAPDADELEGLVLDAWCELRRCAPGWRPDGGALPWNWAAHRLRALASAWVGQYADELDAALQRHPAAHEVGPPIAAVDTEEDPIVVLDRLAADHPCAALYRDALVSVASERDRRIVLEVLVQQFLGDPSPAVTVAFLHDMTSAAVRKVCSRVAARMRTRAPVELPGPQSTPAERAA